MRRVPAQCLTSTALAAMLAASCAAPRSAPVIPPSPNAAPPPAPRVAAQPPPAQPARTRLPIEIYVMSRCPYSADAEAGLREAMDLLAEHVTLRVDYVASEEKGVVRSLRGEAEVRGDIIELCAMRVQPDPRAYLRFFTCLNADRQKLPDGWEACAKRTGINEQALRACASGGDGQRLLRESVSRSRVAGAVGTPTLVIGGKSYEGRRGGKELTRAICAAFGSAKPDTCRVVPEEREVSALIITDRRCKECDTSTVEKSLRERWFSKLKVERLDYAEPAAKALCRELRLRRLPAILFKADVEQAEGYAQLARWLDERKGYKLLRIPMAFDPTAEICDNGIDDTGDGKIDCADKTCAAVLTCRKEIPRRLEIFIMSQCPFAAEAILSMKEVLANFKGRITFDVHYVADQTDEGFSSLHGPQEVAEDLRQLCAKQHYRAKDRYLDYLWCRSKDLSSADWRPCASGAIGAPLVEACASGIEGKRLLTEDLIQADGLAISGSPTLLINNRHIVVPTSRTAEAIKAELCQHNPGLAGCANKLSDQPSSLGGSCGK